MSWRSFAPYLWGAVLTPYIAKLQKTEGNTPLLADTTGAHTALMAVLLSRDIFSPHLYLGKEDAFYSIKIELSPSMTMGYM